jgi:hypothetical protein
MKLMLLAFVIAWFFVCVRISRWYQDATLLAGPTAASCMFLLGATVASSFLVPGALFMAPMWLGIVVGLFVHLGKAKAAANSHLSVKPTGPTEAFPIHGKSNHDYI